MKTNNTAAFTGISPRAWQHPADSAALTALKQIPGLDQVLRAITSFTSDRSLRLLFLGSGVKVSAAQFPRVQAILSDVLRIFDSEMPIEAYVVYNPRMNAGAIGINKPFITINSASLAGLDDQELQALIGHEVAHCLSGHVLYKTMLWILVNAGFTFLRIPGIELLITPIIAALREWDRKSELSADRAGLLAVQDLDASCRLLMKLAGGPDTSQMNLEAFLEQAREYDSSSDVLDSVHKILNTWSMSHPLPVIRLPQLRQWATEGSYQDILSGSYTRRDEAPSANFSEDLHGARQEYDQELKNSADPLVKMMRDLGEGLQNVGRKGEKFLKDLFSPPEDGQKQD